MLTEPALWVSILAMTPLMLVAAYWDLKYLKIPNWVSLAVLAVFIVTGLWGLPLETFWWRLAIGAIVLVIMFVLFAVGAIGGGDAKLAAALAPFVVPTDIATFLLIYIAVSFAMLLTLRLIMQVNRHEETGWLSVDQLTKPARERVFPMGLIFGLTILIY
ncbi:MAG: prepilin peptidase, partial [Pseudomonadota bacterium]